MLTVMFTGVMKLEQHQNDDVPVVLFSKVIPINILENTCPGFRPSPLKNR
jgi:hypothetical protein